MTIRAHDNGRGSQNSQNAGLGTLIYARATDGNWSMGNDPEGGYVVNLTVTPYEVETQVPFLTLTE